MDGCKREKVFLSLYAAAWNDTTMTMRVENWGNSDILFYWSFINFISTMIPFILPSLSAFSSVQSFFGRRKVGRKWCEVLRVSFKTEFLLICNVRGLLLLLLFSPRIHMTTLAIGIEGIWGMYTAQDEGWKITWCCHSSFMRSVNMFPSSVMFYWEFFIFQFLC